MENSELTDTLFLEAVEAIDSGDLVALEQLLRSTPDLVNRRFDIPSQGYFAHPYLLWFVAQNPIRKEHLPSNIVEIAAFIIKVLQSNLSGSYQHQLDYTLALVCTGRVPREFGVQIPLMELLIKEGARVKGSVLGVIGESNFEAAEYLLEKGADYDLATAVGLKKVHDVKNLVTNASGSQLYVALVVASFFGDTSSISFLLQAGADVNGFGKKEDFGGFHSHATPLHQAVSSRSLEAVKLLSEAGARHDEKDKVYDGTALDWAIHLKNEDPDGKRYIDIVNYLSAI